MRNKKGQFAKGNSFARGHGAPQAIRMPMDMAHHLRNINAVKTGVYMRFKEGETPYDRLRGGETELKVWCIKAGHVLMRARREQTEARQRLKAARSGA